MQTRTGKPWAMKSELRDASEAASAVSHSILQHLLTISTSLLECTDACRQCIMGRRWVSAGGR